MTDKEKELLLVDLCGRLPYGVKVTDGQNTITLRVRIDTAPAALAQFIQSNNLKYYLRPLSSITNEEIEELKGKSWCLAVSTEEIQTTPEGFDWLNAHHFDYRGLIPKGLVLEAKEGMYVKE